MIEADFQREYNINLITEAEDMSWRRFKMLLRGLSSNSALAMALSKSTDDVEVIEDKHGKLLDRL